MALQIFVKRVFTIFATKTSFLRLIANLTQYNMQYMQCNSVLLAQETLLHRKTRFLPKDFQKVRKSQKIIILRQNSEC